jgi:hypothetical protein
MAHCVRKYIPACAKRVTSIWSFQEWTAGKWKHRVTIEVGLSTRMICQARGYANRMIGADEFEIIAEWANQESLALSDSVQAEATTEPIEVA